MLMPTSIAYKLYPFISPFYVFDVIISSFYILCTLIILAISSLILCPSTFLLKWLIHHHTIVLEYAKPDYILKLHECIVHFTL